MENVENREKGDSAGSRVPRGRSRMVWLCVVAFAAALAGGCRPQPSAENKAKAPEDLRDRTWRAQCHNVAFEARPTFAGRSPAYEVRYAGGAGAKGEGRVDFAALAYLWLLDSWVPPYVATRVRSVAFAVYPLASEGGCEPALRMRTAPPHEKGWSRELPLGWKGFRTNAWNDVAFDAGLAPGRRFGDLSLVFRGGEGKVCSFLLADLRLLLDDGTAYEVLNPDAPRYLTGMKEPLRTAPVKPRPKRPTIQFGGDNLFWFYRHPDQLAEASAFMRRHFPEYDIVLSCDRPPEAAYDRTMAALPDNLFFQWQKGQHDMRYAALKDALVKDPNGRQQFMKLNSVVATHPVIRDALEDQVAYAGSMGVNAMLQFDYVWFNRDGVWGFDDASAAAFREDLLGKDEGLRLVATATRPARTIRFWDYYEDYYGRRLAPSDRGLKSWADYVPRFGTQEEKDLHVTLIAYEWLRQGQRFGDWTAKYCYGAPFDYLLNGEGAEIGNDHVYESDARKVNVRTDGAKSEVGADARSLSGEHFRTGWISRRKVAYAITFNRPWRTIERVPGTLGTPDEAPRYVATFDVAADESLLMKVALSMTGADGAKRNLAADIPAWDFEGVRTAARAKWNEIFARTTCEGTDDQKRNWYTALYHLYGQPNDYADADGRFSAADGTVSASPDGTSFTTLSLWDTFRAAEPWYTLATPEIVTPIVNSLLSHYRTFGRLPVMSYGGKNVDSMVGNHSVPVIVDAWLKGFRGFDAELAFEAITNTLTVAHPGNPKENWDLYDRYGYFPCDVIKGESVSRTLECAYDDACAARFASALGKPDAAAFFEKRAQNWKNVIDPSIGFARGKTTKGTWRTPFDPYAFGHGAATDNDFTEGNAFQYTWHVMQDVPGLVAALGGRDRFVTRLDALFAAPDKVAGKGLVLDISGMIGQYVHGNEPSHHVIYFYPQVGHPEKAAERIREVFDTQYHVGPEGLCGNDDCGQMSAWYLFSAMGFYPFDPCGGEYVIGAPQLPRMTLRLADVKTFTVVAKNLSKENKYVKSVLLNGRPVTDWKIRHADIVKGGTLVFEMGAVSRVPRNP